MSKPQSKRRYRARKAARNMLRRYPFMRGLKRMRELLEESLGARPILIAAGRRGGKTLLTQEALDGFRHVNWDGPSAWLAKPLAPLPPDPVRSSFLCSKCGKRSVPVRTWMCDDCTLFAPNEAFKKAYAANPYCPPPNIERLDEGDREARRLPTLRVDIKPNIDAIKAGLNYPPLCDGLGDSCHRRAGHDGECEEIPL